MIPRLLVAAALTVSIGLAPGPPNVYCANAAECVYANCTAAEEAGVCDIPRDDPAYCDKQDRDGDGVACECTDW